MDMKTFVKNVDSILGTNFKYTFPAYKVYKLFGVNIFIPSDITTLTIEDGVIYAHGETKVKVGYTNNVVTDPIKL